MPLIEQKLIKILSESQIEKNNLNLTQQLDANTYKQIKDLLLRIGGKWNGKTHTFPENPTLLIQALIETKEWPDKNPHAFFPSPQNVIDIMLEHIYGVNIDVLEPSAGSGFIASAIKAKFPQATIDTCEINPLHVKVLNHKGFNSVWQGDFLNFQTDKKYDYVVMNPPFSYEGHPLAWMEHVLLAFTLLNNNGNLICIAPTGWETKTQKKVVAFKNFLNEHMYSYEKLGKGAFKESGTTVDTILMSISKTKQPISDLDMIISNNYTLYKKSLKLIENELDHSKLEKFADEVFVSGLKENEYYKFSTKDIKEYLTEIVIQK